MKKRLIVCAAAVAALLAGCGGSSRLVGDRVPTAGPTVVSPADSLALADAQYREALGHYVLDEWDEAGPLLERALGALDRSQSSDQEAESARLSLRSRVTYFLGVVEDRGYAVSSPAREDVSVEHSRTDTLSVADDSPPRSDGGISAVPVVMNSRVEKWLDYFQGRGRPEMARWLKRKSRYQPMVERILDEHGLPRELIYLAMIESGLNPKAYSRAHASGMWQFISSRARLQGLRVDWWIDERRDPEKATYAAARYLKELYERFGSWELSLAGYNSGEGRVERARKRRPGCEDFWCLDLPNETENFVPKFMAVMMIGRDPEKYGFETPTPSAPLAYDTIHVADATDLELMAEAAGATLDEMRSLNPALRRWCTPPTEGGADVRVPVGSAERCRMAVDSIPPDKRVTWRRHKVANGETLSEVAAAYGTSVRAICDMNDLRNPNRIRAGTHLVIPIGPGSSTRDYADSYTYVVRRGDTVTSIARRHGKRTRDVLRWNGLSWNSKIYPGDTLKMF